ncbi:MAG: T9SS type A sorting domain-containing protein [Cytophagaceae bacterium]
MKQLYFFLHNFRLSLWGLLLLIPAYSYSQVPPYRLSPRWVFGDKAYLNFSGGGAPTQPARTDNIIAYEGASTLCDPDMNIMVYSNNVRVAGENMTPVAGVNLNNSTSSVQGPVIIPNPTNPTTQFYILTGNAESVYTAAEPLDNAQQGNRRFNGAKSGTSVTVTTPGTSLATNAEVREWLYASTDGDYGYRIITAFIPASGNTEFYTWRIPTTGGVGAKVTSSYSGGQIWNVQYQGSIKVNRCQNRIALVQGTAVGVYNYDRTTGQIGSALYFNNAVSVGAGSKLYGCEFSPNGQYLYFTTLGKGPLQRLNISTSTITSIGSNVSGTLQVAPDGNIYIANGEDAVNNTVLGIITNPDGGGTYNAAGLTLVNSSSVRLGLSNIAWLNPQRPTITANNTSCGSYTFTPAFLTHFKETVGISQAVWDLGDGTTVTNTGSNAYNNVTRNYTSTGNKNITVTMTDNTCSHTWVGTLTINVTCVLPVDLISFDALTNEKQTTLYWATAKEFNNSHFEIFKSNDGVNFHSIGKVGGKGNSNTLSYYTFDDEELNTGIAYYKLMQHDYDGSSEESKIISVKHSDVTFKISPNPSNKEFTIRFSGRSNGKIIIYDLLGKELENIEAENINELNFGNSLLPGTYLVKLINNEKIITEKVIKE